MRRPVIATALLAVPLSLIGLAAPAEAGTRASCAGLRATIVVTGHSDGSTSTSCTGFAKQSPGLRLEVTLTRMRDKSEGRAR